MATDMDNTNPPVGVYKNPRLMHACTAIVGFTVHIQTKDGSVWEGIFTAFSPEFTICLELTVQIDPKLSSKDCLYQALKGGSPAQEKAFFELKDIVRISVVDVDLNYATKDMSKQLATDADISGYDANKSASGDQRQLESWQDDDVDNTDTDGLLSLDEVGNRNDGQNNSRGWDAQDMFRYNERVHKVTTTYDEKLTDYTVPLPKHGTKEWRKRQERATAIAKEIEGNTKSQVRLAKENEGDCEEEKFSAVFRPIPQNRPISSSASSKLNANDATVNTISQPDVMSKQSTGTHQGRVQEHLNDDRPQNTSSVSLNSPATANASNAPPAISATSASSNSSQQAIQIGNPRLIRDDKGDDDNKYNPLHRSVQNRGLNSSSQNGTHKSFRPRGYDRPRIDSLKNFSKQLTLAPSTRGPQNQNTNLIQNSSSLHQSQPQHRHLQPQQQQQSPNQHQSQGPPQNQSQQQQHQPQSQQQSPQLSQQQQSQHQMQVPSLQNQQAQANVSATPPITASTVPVTTSGTLSERDDTSNIGNKAKDHQSELAKNSTLNPNAKEFVYKPRSPATHSAQMNGANQIPSSGPAMIDPANSSPMSQAPHASYYPQVPMFTHGLSPHQQQHPAAQFMQNHTPMHFQNQIHYMSSVPQHFAQQMPQRYIRGNFQNYHHRGEHHNNVRADYTQSTMMTQTGAGQAFVPPPSGAPHPMNAYAASPQQAMIYSGPPQSIYPVVQAGFPQPLSHVMPNPPPYDGSAVYMPQNYIVNP